MSVCTFVRSCTQQWVYFCGGVAVVHNSGFTLVVVLQLYTAVGLPLWWCCSCTQQWGYLGDGVAVVHNSGFISLAGAAASIIFVRTKVLLQHNTSFIMTKVCLP